MRTDVIDDSFRRAKTAATTTPMPTATMRSNDTVMSAVMMNPKASDLVDRRIERIVSTFTIRTAVTKRTPPRAASGILLTGAAATNTMSSSTSA